MTEPDELSIISDGKTVWIYTPMVEQVSAMWLKNIPDNRLLLLLTDNHSEMWDIYQVTNTNNTFHLKPTTHAGQQFDITVKPNGIITNFKIVEEDGQYSIYTFSQQRIGPVDKNKFIFHLPKGVTLDDQRQ
jgi:outer membrane lipoprotein carrier protein